MFGVVVAFEMVDIEDDESDEYGDEEGGGREGSLYLWDNKSPTPVS